MNDGNITIKEEDCIILCAEKEIRDSVMKYEQMYNGYLEKKFQIISPLNMDQFFSRSGSCVYRA